MTVTAKELRVRMSKVLKRVQGGRGVTVTLRGKPVARLVSVRSGEGERDLTEYPAIGIWADREEMSDPAAWVRRIRRPRHVLR